MNDYYNASLPKHLLRSNRPGLSGFIDYDFEDIITKLRDKSNQYRDQDLKDYINRFGGSIEQIKGYAQYLDQQEQLEKEEARTQKLEDLKKDLEDKKEDLNKAEEAVLNHKDEMDVEQLPRLNASQEVQNILGAMQGA